jgi:hypothetical protein
VPTDIVAGLITAALLAGGGLVLRHRKHLRLLRATPAAGQLRVPVAALQSILNEPLSVLRPTRRVDHGHLAEHLDQLRRRCRAFDAHADACQVDGDPYGRSDHKTP